MFEDKQTTIQQDVESLFKDLVVSHSVIKIAYNYCDVGLFIESKYHGEEFIPLYRKLVAAQHELETLNPGVLFVYTYKIPIERFIERAAEGRCAECGEFTNRYDIKWNWYICEDHDSEEVAKGIADHVLNPNG